MLKYLLCSSAGLILTTLAGLAQAQSPAADNCLPQVETAAGQLQACWVEQKRNKGCDKRSKALKKVMTSCAAQTSKKQVSVAKEMGIYAQGGDRNQSEYRLQRARHKDSERILAVNEARYKKIFESYIPYAPREMSRGFGRLCEQAFIGNGKNYAYLGKTVLLRDGGDPLPGVESQPVTHLFFGKMAVDDCYRPGPAYLTDEPAHPDRKLYVYNFQQMMIDRIPSQGRINKQRETRGGNSKSDSPFKLSKPIVVDRTQYEGPLQGTVVKHLCSDVGSCLSKKLYVQQQYEAFKRELQKQEAAKACQRYLEVDRAGEVDLEMLYGEPCTGDSAEQMLTDAAQKISRFQQQLFENG